MNINQVSMCYLDR